LILYLCSQRVGRFLGRRIVDSVGGRVLIVEKEVQRFRFTGCVQVERQRSGYLGVIEFTVSAGKDTLWRIAGGSDR
jgi:hypothetical protein